MKGFRDFILRGNVVDLAVAVVIGAAFGAVVSAFTSSFLTPLIAAIGGKPDFGSLTVTLNRSRFTYGLFINAVLSFLIIAAVVYFLVVLPMQRLMALRKTEPEVDSTVKDCPRCLSKIPVAATRCAFCTVDLPA
jgi:large conductance mechanosensitive channel